MKAILVFSEIPNSCNECKVRCTGYTAKEYKECVEKGKKRPSWCPIRLVPEKKHGRLIDADVYIKKVCTYRETGCGSCKFQTVCPQDEPTINDYLDEIMGETE